MPKHEFHVYASTKTTAQLILDLAAAISHCFSLYVLWKMMDHKDQLKEILFWLIVGTIIFQVILAFGLFALRLTALNGNIGRKTRFINNFAFWMCLVVGILEVAIAGIEKLFLEKHPSQTSTNE